MNVVFIFDKEKTVIKCSDDDYIDDICNKFIQLINVHKNEVIFLFKGKKINQNIKINKYKNKEDLKNNTINIFCIKIKHILKEKLLYNKSKLKEIICPECGEICKIKFQDYKIILYKCKNNHINNIEFENFVETQNIGKSKIKCNYCNKIKDTAKYGEFYYCLECNKYLCILCKEIHDKAHNIIKYEDKNYKCNIHNERLISYCNKCNKNLCLKCENDHKSENSLIYYKDIIPNINDTDKEEMKLKIEQFNNNIKDIIEKLKKTMNKININYEIFSNFVNSYDMINLKNNYQLLNNINKIINYSNTIIIKNINDIIEEPDDYKKIY